MCHGASRGVQPGATTYSITNDGRCLYGSYRFRVPSWTMADRHFRGGGTSVVSTFASMRSIREARSFMGAGPIVRSVCPDASNPVGNLVHAGFELL